jgi:hypothetical protein
MGGALQMGYEGLMRLSVKVLMNGRDAAFLHQGLFGLKMMRRVGIQFAQKLKEVGGGWLAVVEGAKLLGQIEKRLVLCVNIGQAGCQ